MNVKIRNLINKKIKNGAILNCIDPYFFQVNIAILKENKIMLMNNYCKTNENKEKNINIEKKTKEKVLQIQKLNQEIK